MTEKLPVTFGVNPLPSHSSNVKPANALDTETLVRRRPRAASASRSSTRWPSTWYTKLAIESRLALGAGPKEGVVWQLANFERAGA